MGDLAAEVHFPVARCRYMHEAEVRMIPVCLPCGCYENCTNLTT